MCFTTKRRKPGKSRPSFVPRLESLEDRALLSTLTVTNTNDKGPGSLARPARRGGLHRCTADLATEQTMNALFSALARYVRPQGGRRRKPSTPARTSRRRGSDGRALLRLRRAPIAEGLLEGQS
jgi:hypothetical protein